MSGGFDPAEHRLVARHEARFAPGADESPVPFALARELYEALRRHDRRLARIARISDRYQGEVKRLLAELQEADARARAFRECLPICAACKKVRSDEGYWKQIEQFLLESADTTVSHGLCPDCARNYQALARKPGRGDGWEGAPPPATSGPGEPALDDPVVRRFLPTVENAHFARLPLHAELKELFGKYVRLGERMTRIVRISDSYQSELQELNARLRDMARTDPLTGLFNRREMRDRIEAEANRANRHGRPFALLMADIDRFKEVNDRHGHEAGDRVLVAVAGRIRENLRKEDACARWGGEEYLVLLPEADAAGALRCAEILRTAVGSVPIVHEGSRIRATISVGVSAYDPGAGIDRCIAEADAALYEAKAEGRNRSKAR